MGVVVFFLVFLYKYSRCERVYNIKEDASVNMNLLVFMMAHMYLMILLRSKIFFSRIPERSYQGYIL